MYELIEAKKKEQAQKGQGELSTIFNTVSDRCLPMQRHRRLLLDLA